MEKASTYRRIRQDEIIFGVTQVYFNKSRSETFDPYPTKFIVVSQGKEKDTKIIISTKSGVRHQVDTDKLIVWCEYKEEISVNINF